MAQNTGALTGSGYPKFDDPGGPSGLDVTEPQNEAVQSDRLDLLARVAGEIAAPADIVPEGALFGQSIGSRYATNPEGVKATANCLMLMAALAKEKSPISEVAFERLTQTAKGALSRNLGNIACECPVMETLRFCPLAAGGVPSRNGKRFRPIDRFSASSLIGATSSNFRVDRVGALAIERRIESMRTLQVRVNEGTPLTATERMDVYEEIDFFEGWLKANSPQEKPVTIRSYQPQLELG